MHHPPVVYTSVTSRSSTYSKSHPLYPEPVEEEYIILSNETGIQAQQELPVGNIHERPEFNFHEELPRQPERPAQSLHECIVDGTLHMDRAAKFIFDQKQQRTFNQATYNEFVRSDLATKVQNMKFDLLDEIQDPTSAIWLNLYANRLQGDIPNARHAKLCRRVDLVEKDALPSSQQRIIVKNCEKEVDHQCRSSIREGQNSSSN
ncbi:hypothetical protein ANCCAN_15098 [Ancylostoma caninum]|uniref:Uncharacterized protein n=1 Tax=Ancylostoma caninum TaxID=29170 RepID=A0A368G8D5_ANCCA|nr:hypothetical protein ANCCAN_15098 [Ancylostoma caninum]